ncbi:MAG TPA: ATP-binding protein [Trebonia sp.]|nr:ATP-binding protein [Trebonia sp.]
MAADTGRHAGRWWLRFGLGPLLLRWWRRRGLRARVTITAALGLIVAFAALDLILFNALQVSLTRSVDDTARSGAAGVQALIDANRLPDPVPVASDVTVQVLDSSGNITDVSAAADRLVPIVSLARARALAGSGGALMVHGAPLDMAPLVRVVVVPAARGQLVIAAVPFSEASGSLNVVARALVFVTPLLFIAFTGAIWLVTGSTLRPVGALRRGAAQVTVTGVPADLPVPEARDEVRSLALTLNDMLSRLATAQQRQRALVSDTAHELRSPIASIRTQLEVALDFPEGQDWETTARDVHADVLRLARLAEDLLLLARLDEQAGLAAANRAAGGNGGPRTAAGGLVDLEALSRSVACRYADARVRVTVADAGTAGPGAAVFVTGIPERLERLLVNLADNAVRYAKSSVTIAVRQDGAWAELSVTDDGPGIPAANRERAFYRFARLDDARSRDGDEAGGAGLGLAIVRATAQAHGGTAFLEAARPASSPPASSPPANSPAAGHQGPVPPGGTAGSGPGLRAVVRLPASRREGLLTAGPAPWHKRGAVRRGGATAARECPCKVPGPAGRWGPGWSGTGPSRD